MLSIAPHFQGSVDQESEHAHRGVIYRMLSLCMILGSFWLHAPIGSHISIILSTFSPLKEALCNRYLIASVGLTLLNQIIYQNFGRIFKATYALSDYLKWQV